jgi:hypothetical protein
MADARLTLIRFMTARQSDLQGLRNGAFAISVIAMMAVIVSIRPARSMLNALIVVAMWTAVAEGSTRLVDWWYASRYGRVSAAESRRGTSARMLMGLGAAVDLTPWFPVAGYSAFVFVVAAYGAWITFRDFPWRGYHLALVALPGLAPVVHTGTSLAHFVPAYAAALAALAIVGLLDHRLLRVSVDRLKRPQQMGSSA